MRLETFRLLIFTGWGASVVILATLIRVGQ
jgi:hypothetical protein